LSNGVFPDVSMSPSLLHPKKIKRRGGERGTEGRVRGTGFQQVGCHSEPAGTDADSSRPFDIFISHRGPDTKEQFCRGLKDELDRHGYQAFLDDSHLRPGEDAWRTIKSTLQRAEVVIVVLSKNFGRSPWCLMELEIAVTKKFVPVFYDVGTNLSTLKVQW